MSETFYHDVGVCYEFSFLTDDVWKKDEVFTLFSVRLLRLIALEVGVPVQEIRWGKWGGRIVYTSENKSKRKEWIGLIENHPVFMNFKEVCAFPTFRKNGSKEQEDLRYHLDWHDQLNTAKFMTDYLKNESKQAKEILSKENYEQYLKYVKGGGE